MVFAVSEAVPDEPKIIFREIDGNSYAKAVDFTKNGPRYGIENELFVSQDAIHTVLHQNVLA